jgi:RHS repeat-associated protein
MTDFSRLAARIATIAAASVGVWLFAGATGSPPASEQKASGRSGESATLLASGQWLFLGGRVGTRQAVNEASVSGEGEARQPLAQRLGVARAEHTATVLPDGTVLIVGGVNSAGQPVAEVERFRPDGDSFEALGDIGIAARRGHTATLLTTGELLITGGVDVSSLVHDDALLVDPKTMRVTNVEARMSAARNNSRAQLLGDGKVLIVGGVDSAGVALSAAELFDPATQLFQPVSESAVATLVNRNTRAADPAVRTSLPAAGSTGVSVSVTLAMRFSKPLLLATLNEETVTLIGPAGSAQVTVAGAEAGMLLFVTPHQPLIPGSHYTLFVRGAQTAANATLPFTAIGFQTETLSSSTGGITINWPRPQAERTPPEAEPDDADGEIWVPSSQNYHGTWRSGQAGLAAGSLPMRNSVAKALHGKRNKNAAQEAPPGVTALAGQVLKLNATPLRNVTLSIGAQQVVTDDNGEFLLTHVPAGKRTLVINGHSANMGRRQYGRYEYLVDIKAGRTNALPFVIWMTRLDSRNELAVPSPTTAETVLTNPSIPGLELRIPANTVIRDADNNIVTRISMTAIPIDQPPFPLPSSNVPVYFTIQPGGARLQGMTVDAAKGARLIYPNFSKNPAGTRVNFWNYDSRDKGWYVYGQGSVSQDGKQIVPDPGVVIYEFSGAMVVEGGAPGEGPPAGEGSCSAGSGGSGGPAGPAGPPNSSMGAGDPVDCYTGLFLHRRVDMTIDDVIPLEVVRTYRPRDPFVRSFGIGTSLSYDMFLFGTTVLYTFQDLILPDGGRIHYPRISPGTSWEDAVYQNTTTPGRFFGSTIRWNEVGAGEWLLELRDGTVYTFPEAAQQQPRCGALAKIRDRHGNQVVLTRASRSENCMLTEAISPNGRKLTFAYDGAGRISGVSDEVGRNVSYQYDAGGRLATATDAAGHSETYAYDTQDRMLTVTDRRGNVMVTNTYDVNGRVSQQTYADSTTSSFSYTLDSNNKVTQMDYTNERGVVKRVQFNAAGLPISVVNALGELEEQAITIARDTNTNLAQTMTDALGRVTAYQYDSHANLTQLTKLHGTSEAKTWTYTYEPAFSLPASVTDPANHTTSYDYDATGNLIKITDPLGHEVTMSYNSAGQVASRTDYLDGSPQTTTLTYRSGLLAMQIDPLNRATQMFRDVVGRVTTVKDPAGGLWQRSYDPLDRLASTIDPMGRTTGYTYDNNGNLLTFEDERGGVTTYSYDARNRVDTKTDPMSEVESYLYDEIGNRTRVTDRKGQVTGYSYDALNHLTSAGFGATIANPNSYATTVTYTWDDGNRITGAADSLSGTIELEFDGLDRLTQEHNPQGQIDYTYYPDGLRQTMTVLGQPSVNYAYDDADRLTQISQGTTTVEIAYDSMNRRSTLTLPNGIEVSYGYDDASQLTSLAYRNGVGATLGDLTYGYDAAGRRISMGGTFARVNLPEAVASASHDAANRQTSWGTQTFAFDDNGALASNTGQSVVSYIWDERQRLKEIKQGGVTTASFQYDAFNRRIGRVINGVGTNYLNDRWQVVQELSGTTPIANLLTGLRVDEIFRRTVGTVTEDFLTDALGSTIALTDAAGTIRTNYGYQAYGATSAGGGASGNAHQYTGRENDGELYYYRNRYYSPTLHRFISQDPIGFAAGSNVYAYVQGNPLSYSDPFGLAPSTPSPGQTCIDGVGLGCYGDQDNPGKPGTPNPPKERKRKRCVDSAPNYATCHACCTTLSGSAASKGATICIEECMRQQGITSCPVDEGEGDASAT